MSERGSLYAPERYARYRERREFKIRRELYRRLAKSIYQSDDIFIDPDDAYGCQMLEAIFGFALPERLVFVDDEIISLEEIPINDDWLYIDDDYLEQTYYNEYFDRHIIIDDTRLPDYEEE